MLGLLIDVMASVPIGETSFVDLYANLGNADPLVVASALDGQPGEEERLFGPTWIVVSGDKAVQAKAEEFGLSVLTNLEFKDILDQAA